MPSSPDPLIQMVGMLRLHGRLDVEEANALERAHLAARPAPPDHRLRDLLSRAIALLSEWTVEVGDTEPRDANTVRLIHDLRAALATPDLALSETPEPER